MMAALKTLWHRLGSPRWFFEISGPWAIGALIIGLIGIVVGLVWGLAIAPPDYLQGNSFRIMYLHVPFAILSRVLLHPDGPRRCGAADLAHEARRHGGRGRGADRRGVLLGCAADGLDMGTPDVGYVVGVGRAHDVDAGAAVPLLRRDGVASGDSARRNGRPRRRDSRRRRHGRHSDHQIFGRLVADVAPDVDVQADVGAVDAGRNVPAAARSACSASMRSSSACCCSASATKCSCANGARNGSAISCGAGHRELRQLARLSVHGRPLSVRVECHTPSVCSASS